MNRFIQTQNDNGISPYYYEYKNVPLLPLTKTLEIAFPSTINRVLDRIQYAEAYCRYPSNNKLTRDEAAAIYLYTDESNEPKLCNELNVALRSKTQSKIQPWLSYLKLLNTALKKVPTMNGEVWCGISIDLCNKLKEDQEIIWACMSSCSTSKLQIKNCLDSKSILCRIKTIKAKDIREYGKYKADYEILLLPGTRLRVKGIHYDHALHERYMYLVEIDGDNGKASTSSHNSMSSENKPIPITNDVDYLQRGAESAVITFSNGTRYEVTYKNGDTIGYGRFYEVNGITYEGYTVGDKANGKGNRICSNGDRYEGNFQHGKMEGYGTLSRADEYTYVGNWMSDKPHGKGISNWPNGSHYEGDHCNGEIKGRGKFCSVNRDTYEGELVDGKAHGRGLRSWADGDKYKGDFSHNKKHGYGTYTYANGAQYIGMWLDDEMNGTGVFKWPGGKTQYEGNFKNGKRHGTGKLTFANGQIQHGTWNNDKFVR